ncbi:MAG: TolC family protein [Rhodospirillaceae bacterium]
MNTRVLFLLLPFFLLMARGAPASAQDSLSLDEARRIAVANHPLLRAAELTRDAAAESVSIARSSYFPQVNADAVRAFADAGTRIAATGGLNDPTIIDRGSFGVGASQLITDFGRTSSLVESAKHQLEASRDRTALTEAQVVLNVTQAYFDVLRAQSLLKVAESTRQSRQTLFDQISNLRNAKMRSDLDLSIARQGLADAELLLLRARTGIDNGYADLGEALGSDAGGRPALSDTADIPAPPEDLAALQSLAADRNPALRALAEEVKSAREAAAAEARNGYPTVSAVGYAGVTPQRDPGGTIHSNYLAGGVTLDIPLFAGGRLAAREKQASLKADALQQTYNDRHNVLSRDVNIAFGNARTAFENIGVTDQLQRNAQQTLDLTQARYTIGQSSIVDLNQAQLAATQAQIAHTDALFAYRLQRAVLDYETGALAGPSG